ncbi:hypothetical protein [Streptomyces sp. NBC_00572]|uniref:hypothetical protein n=1 Tax=Streptomyces sp. NBC_00572 TaxID=2903664 RepID=UPI0022514CC5|nr:hypothetical protein [Streptomyces sp. NBC_00572]MCX4985552.1 hypothetical protein [Streptomyces sp. NBC_00572]
MAETYPEYAGQATAAATMEWLNVHLAEDYGHAIGVSISLEQAEKPGREGAEFVRKHSFEEVAKMVAKETPAADKLYEELGRHASTPEMKAFADALMVHEPALRDWVKSEVDGNSDGAEKIFAYLERHGISRKEAVTPRRDRESYRGDTQHLVLAFFPDEDLADEAAMVLKDWEQASEHMKVDGVGLLVKDKNGEIKEHKLGPCPSRPSSYASSAHTSNASAWRRTAGCSGTGPATTWTQRPMARHGRGRGSTC